MCHKPPSFSSFVYSIIHDFFAKVNKIKGKNRSKFPEALKKFIFLQSRFDFYKKVCYNGNDIITNKEGTKLYKDDHSGHRLRMVEKMKHGAVCEHEYLEAMLFVAMPRLNTNPLAHRLLAKFGDLKEVFDAPIEKLMEVDGIGQTLAVFIHCAGKMLSIFPYPPAAENNCPQYFHRQEFLTYLKSEYAKLSSEKLDMYLLDADNKIFNRKSFSLAEQGKVRIDTEIFSRVLSEEQPSGIVLVHNHPFGNCAPSEEDDVTTSRCASICGYHNVLFCDHFIYAPSGVYSYYDSGRLADLHTRNDRK